NRVATGLELWYADLESKQARRLTDKRLNALTGDMLQWHPSGTYLLAQVPSNDGKSAPVKPRIPHGPVIQENLGTNTPSRTFSYLLTNAYDEDLFDHYVTSQLTKVFLDGRTEAAGKPAIFKSNVFSPDGSYILVERLERPYSYT